MNQHLKTIHNLLQQNKNLSAADEEALLKAIMDADKQWSITDFKLDRTEKVKKTTAILLEETIAELELKRKAVEEQNRELEIESALERVRSVALGMKKPDDMLVVCQTISQQLQLLKVKEIRNIQTAIFYETQQTYTNYEFYVKHDKLLVTEVDYKNHPVIREFAERMLRGPIEVWMHGFKGQEVREWLQYQKTTNVFIDSYLETSESLNYYWYPLGPVALGISTYAPLNDEEIGLFKRFRNVFELAYRRYLDIEIAEAKAREAKIEAALERVRARALAMQEPEELKEVARVLRVEMGILGVEELETCSIYIHADKSEMTECWYAAKDPGETGKPMITDHLVLNLNDTWVGKQMLAFYNSAEKQTTVIMTGANRREWIEYCYKHSSVLTGFYGDIIPDRTYHLYKFSDGAIGAAAPGNISEESWRMLIRAASVFSLAYSRFKDLTQARTDLIKLKEEKKRAEDALAELQVTQKQLIQSEKMASLGELTAGIAHEIQNPLNFVNNFSDVSSELLDEMKTELEKGNKEDAMAIAEDVKQNLEKILHHGKRADAIVKGMLQHSRTGSGQKEPTDINALADEYLRLAFHGLKAKDKTFNAAMKTDFDETIGLIKIIPQDVGRVILNLITNAFYSVTEKKKQPPEGYEPLVSVSTMKQNDKIEIFVKDNGTGIPQKVLDKIFQPFFTTKPTGQGTGLGLSLSYDIITKGHGGELRVKTKEGEGSEFCIQIPLSKTPGS